jgi:hypothetical protein
VTLLSVCLTTIFGLRFIVWSLENLQPAQTPVDPAQYLADVWMAVRWALAGIALFVAGWFWALGSSLVIHYQARKAPPVPPLHTPESQGIR